MFSTWLFCIQVCHFLYSVKYCISCIVFIQGQIEKQISESAPLNKYILNLKKKYFEDTNCYCMLFHAYSSMQFCGKQLEVNSCLFPNFFTNSTSNVLLFKSKIKYQSNIFLGDDLCCQIFVFIACLPSVGSWTPTTHFKII